MARTKGSRNTTPTFSLATLDVQDAELPARTRNTGPGRYADNPMVDLLRKSYAEFLADATKGGKQVVVTGVNAREVTAYLRAAGQELADEGIGVRVLYMFGDNERTANLKEVPNDDTIVTIMFGAKNRKAARSGDNGDGSDQGQEFDTAEQGEQYADSM